MDIIKELRLRNWARANYVPRNQRPTSLHPIVLDEMALRDAEMVREELIRAATQIVPLAPLTYAIEDAHEELAPPHFLTKPVAREPIGGLPEWGLYAG